MGLIDGNLGWVRDAFALLDDMDAATRLEDVRDRLFALLKPCGIDYFTITYLPQPRERLGPYMLLKVWPDAWLTHYDRSGYYRNDPVGRHCFRTMDPFSWADIPLDPQTEAQAFRVMSEASEHGLREGLCIPLHDINGFQAVVSLAGDRLDPSPSRRRAIHLVSLYAWGAAERLTKRRRQLDSPQLSAREREVLCWIAAGKRAGEVGEILGMADTTVETHLQRAKHKLGTVNTTHTVVEALRQHQIKL